MILNPNELKTDKLKNRMKTKIVIAALAAMAFTACKQDENPEVSKYITIDASVGELTSRATSAAFENGDKISVYAWTGSNTAVQTPLVVDNSINTYDGTQWTAAPQMLWKDPAATHYFIGVYPSKAITNFTADSYTTPTDVLVATVLGEGRNATQGAVPMMFDHVMAKLVVNLTFRNQFGGTPIVESVTTEGKLGATVNYLTKTATADGTAISIALNAVTANTSYQGTLAPQTVTTVQIKIDGTIYTYTHPTPFALLAGKIQTLNLIVGRDKIDLGSIAVNDWTTGETIEGGEAQE